jgi:hypothetical protein
LKEDIDTILIFVCASFFYSASVDVNPNPRLAYSRLFLQRSSSRRFRI